MLPLRPHLNWGGTSCPGKHWPEWVPQLRDFIRQKEDDMVQLKTITAKGRPGQWITDGFVRRPLPAEVPYKEQLIKLGLLDPVIRQVPVKFFDWLLVPGSGGSGDGGPTADQILDRMAQRLAN